MPLACLPIAIGGRNRMGRRMLISAVSEDTPWKGGAYATAPRQGLRTAVDMLLIAGSAPIALQQDYPSGKAMHAYLTSTVPKVVSGLEANDLLYQLASSRDYDPSAHLAAIRAKVMWVNSEDDFINPPYLGVAQQQVKKISDATYVLISASTATHGHGAHTWAALWKSYLVKLLALQDSAWSPCGEVAGRRRAFMTCAFAHSAWLGDVWFSRDLFSPASLQESAALMATLGWPRRGLEASAVCARMPMI
jgi:homoserine O-acetyltransferase